MVDIQLSGHVNCSMNNNGSLIGEACLMKNVAQTDQSNIFAEPGKQKMNNQRKDCIKFYRWTYATIGSFTNNLHVIHIKKRKLRVRQ